jgi:hypothetical protein
MDRMNETGNPPGRGSPAGKLTRVANGAVTGIILVSGLWLSLVAAWYSLSAFNFFYAAVYDLAGIEATIETYAPGHRYKRAFETTTREERIALFGQIVTAVNHGGEGLETIVYCDAEGRPIDTLLRKAEIIHLQDVANLITRLRRASWVAGLVFCMALALRGWQGKSLPKPGHVTAATVVCVAALSALILLSGAKAVFYKWHTLVFPEGHQWFFYYEDSLMTLLMKAPDLFAYLAVLLVLCSLGFFYLLLVIVRLLLERNRVRLGNGGGG